MKKFLALSLVALFVALFSFNAYAEKKNDKNTAEVTFVTTIDCKNCVKKVEAQLPFVAGVKDMKVTLEDKTVWVKYDTRKTDTEKLAKAINKMGYEAEVVTPEAAPAK
ncbi:MAG: heavy-metal-associated domain-containing protein [Bacteroidales bacterium]|nr:heavy-metal-associated domain-containing protein [Bacteroidales bacterium]